MGAGYSMKAQGPEADVYIYEDVGESWFGGVSAKTFADDLRALGKVETINLHINSYGGEVFEGVTIYSQLVNHPARVVTHIDGIAASIASVIAMAGDEIRIAAAGFVMIHDASGGVFGRSGDMRRMADLLDTITGTIADVYVARTKAAADQLRAWMDAETWFTAAEAVEHGFADSMVENLKVAAHVEVRADVARHDFRHAPALLTAPPVAAQAVVIEMPERPLLPRSASRPSALPSASSALAARVNLQKARLAASQVLPRA